MSAPRPCVVCGVAERNLDRNDGSGKSVGLCCAHTLDWTGSPEFARAMAIKDAERKRDNPNGLWIGPAETSNRSMGAFVDWMNTRLAERRNATRNTSPATSPLPDPRSSTGDGKADAERASAVKP